MQNETMLQVWPVTGFWEGSEGRDKKDALASKDIIKDQCSFCFLEGSVFIESPVQHLGTQSNGDKSIKIKTKTKTN